MANKMTKRTTAAKNTATRKPAIKLARARFCACGCGKLTARTFAPGHDAKARSLLLKVERGELNVSDSPPALRVADIRKGNGPIARLLRRVEA